MLEIAPQIPFILLAAAILIVVFFITYFILINKMPHRDRQEIPQEPDTQNRTIFVDLSPKSADIVELAVEVWRMNNRLMKVEALTETQQRGFNSSLQKFGKFLDRYEVKIVDHTGERYNEGMNVDVLSFENDPSVKVPTIKETVEPSITHKGHTIKKGKIIVVNN